MSELFIDDDVDVDDGADDLEPTRRFSIRKPVHVDPVVVDLSLSSDDAEDDGEDDEQFFAVAVATVADTASFVLAFALNAILFIYFLIFIYLFFWILIRDYYVLIFNSIMSEIKR